MFHLQWLTIAGKKRYVHAGATHVQDSSDDRHFPLFLQLPVNQPLISMNDLIQAWHVETEMTSALLSAADLVCIHIDRFYMLQGVVTYNACQVTSFDTICLPFFDMETGNDCVWHKYTLLAVVRHHGVDAAGHYTALLYMQSAFPDMMALQTDDNMRAQFIDPSRTSLGQHATTFWYAKDSCVRRVSSSDMHTFRQDLKLASLMQ